MPIDLEESRDFYRDFFENDWELTYNNRQRYEIVFSSIDSLNLGSETTVLDVGAGSGRISRFLDRHFDSVVPLDIVIAPLLDETIDDLSLDVIEGALPDLPIVDNSFDLVICSEVLEHLPERTLQAQSVKELYRITSPGGWVIISTPNPNSIYIRTRNVIEAAGQMFGIGEADSGGQLVENWIPPRWLRKTVDSHFEIRQRRGSYYALPDFGTGFKKYLHPLSDALTDANIAPSLGVYQYYVAQKPR